MGSILIFYDLYCPRTKRKWWKKLSRIINDRAVIQTRGRWVRSAKATAVLCSPTSPSRQHLRFIPFNGGSSGSRGSLSERLKQPTSEPGSPEPGRVGWLQHDWPLAGPQPDRREMRSQFSKQISHNEAMTTQATLAASILSTSYVTGDKVGHKTGKNTKVENQFSWRTQKTWKLASNRFFIGWSSRYWSSGWPGSSRIPIPPWKSS